MQADASHGTPWWVRAEYATLAVAALLAFMEAREGVRGDHAVSRLATVYSLTQYGTWFIDNPDGTTPNPFEPNTIDKVMVRGIIADGVVRDGRIISSKPPLLPLLMTGEFWVLHQLAGWQLDDEDQRRTVLFIMTLSFVGGSYLLILLMFRKALAFAEISAWARVYLLAALAFGTQLWGFSGKMSNHVPAAAMLMLALYFAIGLAGGFLAPKPWRFALFGLSGALAAAFDLPMSIFVAAAGAALLIRFPRQTLLWVSAGAAIPLALHFAIMVHVTGSPLPVQMRKETYLFESSYWRHPMGIDALNEPKGTYLFHILLGRAGTFSLYPVLSLGIVAALRAVITRDSQWRRPQLLGLVCLTVLTAYYTLSTNNYGGESYGFRWFIGAMPILLLMAAPLVTTCRRPWQMIALALMLVVSLYSGWECAQTDWESGQEWTSRIFGPAYHQLTED
ncbi:MAG: hypothetical protein IT365_23670 [Candidatus Hydrogenedentes bacterium]|nr:hypothetical protein [Candidatus Hydrogenedentota bacterium]